MGPGALTLSEIVAWLNEHDIDDVDSRLEITTLIRDMDRCWLQWANAQKPSEKT